MLIISVESVHVNSIQFHQIPTYLFPLSQLFQNLCNGHFWIRKLVMNTNAGHIIEFTMQIYGSRCIFCFATFKIDAA
ncbi:hypothetical protein T4D_11669 [Trichinella pseudospiralis]|uniref:Uncharacterized protein n=1 Tax=Trichinella pseudospiralis TaxID=6337 RepID=A0A0V1FFC1_TRIPS|nr:hypothetical protein T4D_11669 [Trichinella pseudospiralis]